MLEIFALIGLATVVRWIWKFAMFVLNEYSVRKYNQMLKNEQMK